MSKNNKRRSSSSQLRPTGASGSSKARPGTATTAPAPPIGLIIAVCLAAIAVVVVVVLLLFNRDQEPLVGQGSQNSLPSGQGTVVSAGADLPQVVMYSDYSCPSCAEFEQAGGVAVFEAAEEGRIALTVVQLSFVLGGTDGVSTRAANAAQCADDQGIFTQYHRALFDWPPEMLASPPGPAYTDDDLTQLAGSSGLDEESAEFEQFSSCIADRQYQEYVSDMQEQSERDDVGGTPRLYVDGDEVPVEDLLRLSNDPAALDSVLGLS